MQLLVSHSTAGGSPSAAKDMPRSHFRIHKLFVELFESSGRVSDGLLSIVILERSEGPALVHHLLQIREREIGQAGPSLRSRMTVESR
jgi:hypothetical protein